MSYNEKKSIFIGGIWHETNTYSNKKTFIKDFKSYQWHENNNLIKKNLNTNTEIGGFLDVLNQKNANVIPSLFAAAVPSGVVTKKTFLKIVLQIRLEKIYLIKINFMVNILFIIGFGKII